MNAIETRALYMVLSAASLPYARLAIESLFSGSAEPLHLHLITDSAADRDVLASFMDDLPRQAVHGWSIYAARDFEEPEAEQFAHLPNLRAFRRGHPCWRKITDPLLLAAPGDEIILLDPDLYFPNGFTFEATPSTGVLLMWQKPNCLAPQRIVRAAMEAGIPLANHVDIGVAQWRGPADMEWLEWLIGTLGGAQLPHRMHIEAIVWSALAMQMGGGYLDPAAWHCWHRTQMRRVKRLLKVRGAKILQAESWDRIKCFHGGGEAKWWIPEAAASGMFAHRTDRTASTRTMPFEGLTRSSYDRELRLKRILRGLGYYSLFRRT